MAAAGTPCPNSKELQTTTNANVERHERRMKLGKYKSVANVLLDCSSLAIEKGKEKGASPNHLKAHALA